MGAYHIIAEEQLADISLNNLFQKDHSSDTLFTGRDLDHKGYLALRNAKAYDSSNEIGELYTGDTVQLIDTSDATYWYVHSPKLGKNGFVNKNYLTGGSSSSGTVTKISQRK